MKDAVNFEKLYLINLIISFCNDVVDTSTASLQSHIHEILDSAR